MKSQTSTLRTSRNWIKTQTSKLGYGDYLRFRDLVLERSGLYFPEKKKNDLEIGLFKAISESSLASVNGGFNLNKYYNLLRDTRNPTGCVEMERLINALTVGETYFFRNEAQFNALATQVLPGLITRKRAAAAAIGADAQPQLRIWSAGCATGQEAYSLAILLKELLPDIENWHILILATDINQDSLASAKEALYTNWSFREPRAKAWRPLYFNLDPATKRYRLRDDIKRMVTFASLNLIDDIYPAIHNNTSGMDLILCRNVTIYFTETDTRSVIKRFHKSLVDGGWLIVGHSEPSLVVYRAFQARSFPDTLLYQKTGQATPWPDDWQWLDQVDAASTPTRALNPQQAIIQHPSSSTFTTVEAGVNAAMRPDKVPYLISENKVQAKNVDVSVQSELSATPKEPPGITVSNKPAPAPSPEADPYMVAGVLLYKGHIEEAIDELHQKLAVAPNFAPAHSLLGRAYANQGHWAEAQRWCESALALDNLLAEAYFVLALIYEHKNELQLAIGMLKKAIYLERDMPVFHFNLAILYKKNGQTEKAQRTCRNVIRILETQPPGSIVPDTGGVTTKRLLEATQRLLSELND